MHYSTRELIQSLPEFVRLSISDFSYLEAVLDTHYNAPWRWYHTTMHVKRMMDRLNTMPVYRENRLELYLAVLFHDLVYEIPAPAGRNESRSAELAARMIRDFLRDNINVNFLVMKKFIMATTHDDRLLETDFEKLIADLDLENFEANFGVFAQQSTLVGYEYSAVYGEEAWRAGRKQFLEGMLAKPRIYHTEHFNEEKARENIKRMLETL